MKLFYAKNVSGDKLLKGALAEYYGIYEFELKRNENGKPYLKDIPLYFNLSDSGSLCALAVGDEECGLDIQKREKRTLTALRRRLTPLEREEDFFELWTAKEAYVKYLGGTLAALLPTLEYREGAIYVKGNKADVAFFRTELLDCALSLCTAEPVEIELIPFDLL